ncbi:MAG TPA: hypothetical protein VGE01_04640 [Fimbriimonas sp.]
MQPAELIDLWEQGAGRSSVERGGILAGKPPDAPVGTRNAALLSLRERLFGPSIEALACCPACGTWVEFSFDAGLVGHRPDEDFGSIEFELAEGRYRIDYRLPTSLDLAFIMRFANEAEAAAALAARCVLRTERNGEEVPAIPEDAVDRLGEHLNEVDPGSAPSIRLSCSDCGHEWSALFDVEPFVWRELSLAAKAVLGDVHQLAQAYGWTESEVLSLSPARRRVYLEMVRG